MLQSQLRGSPRGLVLKLFCLTSQFTCSLWQAEGEPQSLGQVQVPSVRPGRLSRSLIGLESCKIMFNVFADRMVNKDKLVALLQHTRFNYDF